MEGNSRPRATPDLGVVDGLVQLSALVQAVLVQSTGTADLSVLQGRLLGVLRDREPTMAQLGRLLDLDKSSTTGLVDRAVHRGLVRRAEVPEDRRAFRVVLTDEGRRAAEQVTAEVNRQVSELTDGLSDTNRHRLSLLASQIVYRHAAAHGIDLSAGFAP
ncbi:MAG: MarR family transcriptional regulator [Streptosporangiaceae bacterium]